MPAITAPGRVNACRPRPNGRRQRRGTNPRAYPWGDASPTCDLVNGYVTNTCVGDTSQVGSYLPGASPYGVLDMAGNVLEWVSDWHSDSYYSIWPYLNPIGPDTGTYKAARGGSFYGYHLQTANRMLRPTGPSALTILVSAAPPLLHPELLEFWIFYFLSTLDKITPLK